jgi:hypothetical protein
MKLCAMTAIVLLTLPAALQTQAPAKTPLFRFEANDF